MMSLESPKKQQCLDQRVRVYSTVCFGFKEE